MPHDTQVPEQSTWNDAAERAVLGGLLLDPTTLPDVRALVAPTDFYNPAHVVIFEAMLALQARDEPLDVVTLATELRARKRLNTVGGGQYLGELTDTIPTTAHIHAHARIVRDLARWRRAIDAHTRAVQMLQEGQTPEAARLYLDQTTGAENAATSTRIADDFNELIAVMHRRASGEERALSSPWPRLDKVLGGGFWPGLYTLVGGTGAGKTQFAVQTAVQAAQSGATVLYVALELSRRDIAARVLGVLTGARWSALLRGALSEIEISNAVMRAERLLRSLPFYTECALPYGYGVETFTARAWTLRPALVVLDYLQLCGRPGEELRVSIGRTAYAARAIARDLGAVVLALSSTARENYSKLIFSEETSPADFVGLGKESGEVEYASDGVLVLARGTKPDSIVRRLVVAKNRSGPTGVVDLTWNGDQFREAAPGSEMDL